MRPLGCGTQAQQVPVRLIPPRFTLPAFWLTTSCQSTSSKPEGAFTPLLSHWYFQGIFRHCQDFPTVAICTDPRNHLRGRKHHGMVCLQPEIVSCSCNNIAINTSLVEQLMVLYFRRTPGPKSARRAEHFLSSPKSKEA